MRVQLSQTWTKVPNANESRPKHSGCGVNHTVGQLEWHALAGGDMNVSGVRLLIYYVYQFNSHHSFSLNHYITQ